MFYELQAFTPVSFALLVFAGMGSLAVTRRALPVVRWGIPALLVLAISGLWMQTRIANGFLTVTFGLPFPLYRWRIAVAEIATASVIGYRPLMEFNGWGVRGRQGDRALTARGLYGVQITLKNGDRVLIGSQRAEELADILRRR